MIEAIEAMTIGQRVRVIDGSLVHYRQVGTIVAAGRAHDWYVHLDYDNEHPDLRILFHVEELEAVSDVPRQRWHDATSSR